MNIRCMILAGVLCLPLAAGSASAAETGNALVNAARLGDRAAVIALLRGPVKDDVAGPHGVSALIWAAHRNDLQMVDLLLSVGVNIKGGNEFGATALYADAAMASKLLGAGADANGALLSGETPLMEAARRGNLATARALLSGGANPNAKENNGGQSVLMWAVSERHAPVVEELIRRGADIHARSKAGFTPLMFATQQGDVDSARILIAAGARPNDVMPNTGLTPLIIASAMGRRDVVTLLLEKGADANAVDAQGFTPLHHAALEKGTVDIVKALLKHDAKPDVRLIQPKPTFITISGIVMQGATALAMAAEINNLEVVKVLVEAGADPHIPTDLNTTPLSLAAGTGTDVSRVRSPEERATAVQTVKFLAEHGADVNVAGQFGWTALHGAAFQGLNDVIDYLAGKGARLDTKDSFGQTPLSVSMGIVTKGLGAAYYQTPRVYWRETAELLLKLGATPLEQSGVEIASYRAGE
jgi:uncharacterized protein